VRARLCYETAIDSLRIHHDALSIWGEINDVSCLYVNILPDSRSLGLKRLVKSSHQLRVPNPQMLQCPNVHAFMTFFLSPSPPDHVDFISTPAPWTCGHARQCHCSLVSTKSRQCGPEKYIRSFPWIIDPYIAHRPRRTIPSLENLLRQVALLRLIFVM
jgi:hypothetical protein